MMTSRMSDMEPLASLGGCSSLPGSRCYGQQLHTPPNRVEARDIPVRACRWARTRRQEILVTLPPARFSTVLLLPEYRQGTIVSLALETTIPL